MFDKIKCRKCNSKVKGVFDFCPYCGFDLRNPQKDLDDFGILGKNELIGGAPFAGGFGGIGISEKMINSLMKNLMNMFDKQMKNNDSDICTDVQTFPNGVKIRFGVPVEKKKKKANKKVITQEQIERMFGMPRVEGKTNVRRFSDKVIYEIKALGVESVDDVFVSKLESGYEIKAIGKRNVYVNSLPVNLPLKCYTVTDRGLIIEFGLGR